MALPKIVDRARNTVNIDQMFRNQLLWMLALRVILYTLLLALSYILRSSTFDIVIVPPNLLVLFLLIVYLTTSFSAFYLLVYQGNLRKFGFAQTILDTCLASLLVFFSGSSSSIFTSVFFFPIIAGGLLLPRKGGLLAAAAAAIQYGTLLFLESYGLYPQYLHTYLFLPTTPSLVVLNHFSVHGLTFFLAALLSTLFGFRLRKTESALSDSLKKFDKLAVLYKQIFDNISTGIVTIDSAGCITSANNAVGKIIGIDPFSLVGQQLNSIFPKMDLNAENHRMITSYHKADGSTLRIGYSNMDMDIHQFEENLANTASHPKIITLQDISEIEKLESQVRQAEKLAAIGMMSASIAHDFRNPLTAISGSAQILAHEMATNDAQDSSNYELTHIILRESNRLIETVSDFLKFSRPEHATSNWFSLRGCLKEVLQVCTADPNWPSTCQINLDFDDTFDIWSDERQMFTVFSHLIQNSLAFCPEGKECITIDGYEFNLPDGSDAVKILISDNGSGITVDNKEMIFEPFYTTRPDGTGLGLAIVKQTIETHHGSISATNNTERGALFTITLPLPS